MNENVTIEKLLEMEFLCGPAQGYNEDHQSNELVES
jgi:hypothetical protein